MQQWPQAPDISVIGCWPRREFPRSFACTTQSIELFTIHMETWKQTVWDLGVCASKRVCRVPTCRCSCLRRNERSEQATRFHEGHRNVFSVLLQLLEHRNCITSNASLHARLAIGSLSPGEITTTGKAPLRSLGAQWYSIAPTQNPFRDFWCWIEINWLAQFFIYFFVLFFFKFYNTIGKPCMIYDRYISSKCSLKIVNINERLWHCAHITISSLSLPIFIAALLQSTCI